MPDDTPGRDDPVLRWHYVSYGMTDLYEKETEEPTESCWNFEFTFRLPRDPAGTDPPIWPANLPRHRSGAVHRRLVQPA